jgi:hypothetical protein
MRHALLEYVAGARPSPSQTAPFDVVFVHGLTGDPIGSWSNAAGDFWPRWLAADFPDLNVYSAGYGSSASASPRRGAGASISDLASILLDALLSRPTSDRPLLFIAHSLGGLVVKQALRKSCAGSSARRRAVAKNTLGVFFFATPHAGAQIATAVNSILRVAASQAVRDLDYAADSLIDLAEWFSAWAVESQLAVESYYETEKYKGNLIVDKITANPNVYGCDPVAVQADHVEITKLPSRDCQVYKSICAHLAELLRSRPSDSDASPGQLDPDLAEDLAAYMEQAPTDRRSLEQKLRDADREEQISWAVRQKERFAMRLERNGAQAAAIRSYTRLMSNIETRFQRHVVPLIARSESPDAIDVAIQDHVLDPCFRAWDADGGEATPRLVDSAFYYLAGNCYIGWDDA